MDRNDAVSVLLKKINAIAKINSEIITRIKNQKTLCLLSYLVKATSSEDGFPVFSYEELKSFEPAEAVLQRSWKSISVKLVPIKDLFNDHIDYGKCQSF